MVFSDFGAVCLWRVWNEAAAHRLSSLGHTVRRGDLVWRQEEPKIQEETGESSSPQVREHTPSSLCPLLLAEDFESLSRSTW